MCFFFPHLREKRVALSFWFYGLCFGSYIFLFLPWIVKGRGNEGLAFLYSGLFMVWNNDWPLLSAATAAKFPKIFVSSSRIFLYYASYKILAYWKVYRWSFPLNWAVLLFCTITEFVFITVGAHIPYIALFVIKNRIRVKLSYGGNTGTCKTRFF